MIQPTGGPERFCARLDSLSVHGAGDTSKGVDDLQGRIGEYWHGNEPSHHIAYLYAYAGQPWKPQELLQRGVDTVIASPQLR